MLKIMEILKILDVLGPFLSVSFTSLGRIHFKARCNSQGGAAAPQTSGSSRRMQYWGRKEERISEPNDGSLNSKPLENR